MKLKYFIYSICLAGIALASCQKEDELGNVVDTSSPYVLDYLADSTDEIDQRRYEIYKTYGVAVFLNDVITEEVIGTDYKGDPIYKRETLDISWDFSSDPNTSYDFTYLISGEELDETLTEEEKEQKRAEELANAHLALDYVETYLSMAGGTKPFSILLLKEFVYNGSKTEFYKSFRTLYIGNACDYPDEADMRAKSGEIINATVLPEVQKNEELVAEFETVCKEKQYYNKQWQNGLGETFSAELKAMISATIGFKLSHYHATDFDQRCNNWANSPYVMYGALYGINVGIDPAICRKIYQKPDVVREICHELVDIAARYGFVGGGWSSETLYSPTTSSDVQAYVKLALQLGAGGFEACYGEYPLVMQKFNLLRDFIENELGLSLDYNNVN